MPATMKTETPMKQYHQPAGDFNVGDCMPFSHDGTFHLFYLIDEGHHKGKGGLGGHQWAHVSTTDLVHWQSHPLAIATDEDWEASICTGSIFYGRGRYHAFYAVRKPDWSQHFGYAVSEDGVTFRKLTPPASVVPPAGCARNDFRDPFVFEHEGKFHLLITARLDPYPLKGLGGCLLRFFSADLETWQPEGTFAVPGNLPDYANIPECPDVFFWNGWYYLLFGQGLKPFYRMSRQPLGPWMRPVVDALDGWRCAVMKTAPFGADRRIGVGWAGPTEDKDSSPMLWGGRAVFREMVQREDGTLGTKFPPEIIPAARERLNPVFRALTPGVGIGAGGGTVEINAASGLEVGAMELPVRDILVRCRVTCGENTAAFGLGLRGSGAYEHKYDLRIDLHRRELKLATETLPLYPNPGLSWSLDMIVKDDIIDVCVNDDQCLIHRLHELDGNTLFFFCEDGRARFEELRIDALAPDV